MNNDTFEKAYKSLKSMYEPLARAGHLDSRRSLDDLNRLFMDREIHLALFSLRENPHIEKLLKLVKGRYIAVCERQQGRTIRTELEQKIDNLDKDWAIFILTVLGGNAQEMLEKQVKEMELWVDRLKK